MRRVLFALLVGFIAVVPIGTFAHEDNTCHTHGRGSVSGIFKVTFDGASTHPVGPTDPKLNLGAVVAADGEESAFGAIVMHDSRTRGTTTIFRAVDATATCSDAGLVELSFTAMDRSERELLILVTPRIIVEDMGQYPALATVTDSAGGLVDNLDVIIIATSNPMN